MKETNGRIQSIENPIQMGKMRNNINEIEEVIESISGHLPDYPYPQPKMVSAGDDMFCRSIFYSYSNSYISV